VWILCLGGIPRDHLERLAERIVTARCLLIPLGLGCSVGGAWLNARCCRHIGDLSICTSVGRWNACVKLCEAGIGYGGVGHSLRSFCLWRSGLRLCDLVDPGFLCSEGGLVKCSLLDLGICPYVSMSFSLGNSGIHTSDAKQDALGGRDTFLCTFNELLSREHSGSISSVDLKQRALKSLGEI
jgi:hypothetical protein